MKWPTPENCLPSKNTLERKCHLCQNRVHSCPPAHIPNPRNNRNLDKHLDVASEQKTSAKNEVKQFANPSQSLRDFSTLLVAFLRKCSTNNSSLQAGGGRPRQGGPSVKKSAVSGVLVDISLNQFPHQTFWFSHRAPAVGCMPLNNRLPN